MPSDKDVVKARTTISDHVVDHKIYSQEEKTEFLDGADPWLIAHALAHQWTVVTHETETGKESRKIKIPNVCVDLEVPYTTVYKMLEAEGANFVLGPTRENAG